MEEEGRGRSRGKGRSRGREEQGEVEDEGMRGQGGIGMKVEESEMVKGTIRVVACASR